MFFSKSVKSPADARLREFSMLKVQRRNCVRASGMRFYLWFCRCSHNIPPANTRNCPGYVPLRLLNQSYRPYLVFPARLLPTPGKTMELYHDPHEHTQKSLLIACIALSPGGFFLQKKDQLGQNWPGSCSNVNSFCTNFDVMPIPSVFRSNPGCLPVNSLQ